MVDFVEKTQKWKDYLKTYNNGNEDIALLVDALKEAFFDIDKSLRLHQDNVNSLNDLQSKDVSGCTSVTCMITPKYIICANAGDSRCVLGTNDMVKAMSEDHKPFDEGERKRIENAGGVVQWKRVDGDLAVSRALGDFQYKNRDDLPPQQQKVSCEPDIVIHERSPNDDVLLLACDGLWDVMSNEEAIDKVRSIYALGESNVVLIAEEMIDTALNKGSRDNISAIIVKLEGAKIASESLGGVTKLRHDRKASSDLMVSGNNNFADDYYNNTNEMKN